jgi:hypothetical protein
VNTTGDLEAGGGKDGDIVADPRDNIGFSPCETGRLVFVHITDERVHKVGG